MKFTISRAKGSNFDSGLRGFFKYRSLGIGEATSGDFGANVIKAIPGEHPKGDWHYHQLKFQMVYILEGRKRIGAREFLVIFFCLDSHLMTFLVFS